MPTIVLDGTGITKAALVEMAYGYCGLNEFEYERTPEEMTTGLMRLNALMAGLLAKGIDLGFDFPTYANGLLEEPSGIPDHTVEAVAALVAQRLAPALGATLSEDAKAVLATAVQDLYAYYAATPPSMVPTSRITTNGLRHQRVRAFQNIDTSQFGDPGDLAGIADG